MRSARKVSAPFYWLERLFRQGVAFQRFSNESSELIIDEVTKHCSGMKRRGVPQVQATRDGDRNVKYSNSRTLAWVTQDAAYFRSPVHIQLYHEHRNIRRYRMAHGEYRLRSRNTTRRIRVPSCLSLVSICSPLAHDSYRTIST